MARKLHIGGTEQAAGWEVLNALPAPYVDHLGNANDLSRFPDGVFSEIYASHILEHLDYAGEIQSALREWHRVLEPGGRVSISVPDMDVLAGLFLAKDRLSVEDRFFIMRMIFGGHVDKFDYHVVGLNEDFLRGFLLDAGFESVTRVEEFGLFNDGSILRYMNVPISLNLQAAKPLAWTARAPTWTA
jgi:predicted SAM-dependent methyltransferase